MVLSEVEFLSEVFSCDVLSLEVLLSEFESVLFSVCCFLDVSSLLLMELSDTVWIVSSSNDGFDASSVYHGTLINDDLRNEWYLYYNGRNGVNEYIGFVKKKNNIID